MAEKLPNDLPEVKTLAGLVARPGFDLSLRIREKAEAFLDALEVAVREHHADLERQHAEWKRRARLQQQQHGLGDDEVRLYEPPPPPPAPPSREELAAQCFERGAAIMLHEYTGPVGHHHPHGYGALR